MEEGKTVVFIDGDTLGKGSEELGRVLVKNFLNTLAAVTPKPWRIILMNTGVRLATDSHECASVLKDLTGQGVEVLSCGTCLDYYGLKQSLSAGRASTMHEITG